MSKMIFVLLVSFGIICQASAGILQQNQGSCCLDNSIIVNGQGTVKVQPDIAIVNVGITNTAQTSQQASSNVADKIDQITKILTKNNISTDDIQTQSLTIYPQYEYPNGKMELVGQTASQTLSVTVRGIDKNGGNLGSIIDQLVTVDELTFNGLTFDKEDKSNAQKKARKLAFEDARKKAQQYADLSGRTLGKVLAILDDNGSSSIPPVYADARAFTAKSSASTQVSVGTLEISYTISTKHDLR